MLSDGPHILLELVRRLIIEFQKLRAILSSLPTEDVTLREAMLESWVPEADLLNAIVNRVAAGRGGAVRVLHHFITYCCSFPLS